MATWTLGIAAFYHDSAAVLVRDGEIVAAAQEERFSRIKHDASFPSSAINFCLEQGEIRPEQLSHVVFYEKPLRSFERMIAAFQSGFWGARQSWLRAAPNWIADKLHVEEIIAETVGIQDRNRILFVPHHLSHAASAFYPSPFEEAAILTIDGVGEWTTAAIGVGSYNHVGLVKEMCFPDSLGLLYSAVTHFCGFKVNSGEYKLMGLAPYGEPRFLDALFEYVASIDNDGYVAIDQSYFDYQGGQRMTSAKFDDLFEGPARRPESPITRREMDMAASVQAFTEIAVEKMAAHAKDITNMRCLCMAGGVALNCVANGKLLRQGIFEDIWIQPAAGDAGTALGAALAVQHGLAGVDRQGAEKKDAMKGAYLGPEFSPAEIEAYLESYGIPFTKLARKAYGDRVSKALEKGGIVGFFQGRMEFGPRALGARSILGNPVLPETQKHMNLCIKYRESFRPFAPSVLAEDVADYFELACPSPYMLLVAPVREDRRIIRNGETAPVDLLASVNQPKSDIPAVTHWDYSARIQTVHKETNPVFHDVISAFKRRTGISIVVNTSFNIRGEPIVCTPDDAYQCFMNTEMDYLFLDGYWIEKTKQPERVERDREQWRKQYALD